MSIFDMSSNAFILTGDEPVSAHKLKRLLLTHNVIYFSDVSDEAIINEDELIESFPQAKIGWAARGHYPRVDNYEERYYRGLRGAENPINRKLIQPIVSKNIKTIDPGIHWMSYSASLSNEELIRAAAIGASKDKPHLRIPDTIFYGLIVTPSGMRSKYAVDYKESFKIQGIHDDWDWIIKLRVGRALKSIRIAQALGATPVALDEVNSQIALSLIQQNTPFTFSVDDLIDFSIEAEVIDNDKLEQNLMDASWEDILKMRKEVLPSIAKTKSYLSKKTNILSRKNIHSVEIYLHEIQKMKDELIALKIEEADAWESLRIGAILKAGTPVGLVGFGSLALPTLVSFTTILTGLISAGLISASALSQELKALIPAKRKLREHPLFLIEKIQQ